MTADTADMALEVEYLKNDKTAYKVQNIDFGIIERPRTKIVLEKYVSQVKLTATDGTTIFDTNQQTSNLTWVKNNYDRQNGLSEGRVIGTVDENILYGSTLNVRYTLILRNHSELDYIDQSYYYTGVVSNRNSENTIRTTAIIEYVPNSLQYDAELTKQNGRLTYAVTQGNGAASASGTIESDKLWQIIANRTESIRLPNEYRGTLIEPGAFDEAKDKIDEILLTNLPGDASQYLRHGDYIEMKDVLTLTRVIARSEDTTDEEEMQNIAEIIRLDIANGRRPYYEDTTQKEVVEIPGNTYPSTLKNIEEIDTGRAEILTFVVPFGANKQLTLIIVTIVSLAILVTGIIVIKKKVL